MESRSRSRVPWASPDTAGSVHHGDHVLQAEYGFAIGPGAIGTPSVGNQLQNTTLIGWSNAVASTHYSGSHGDVRWRDCMVRSKEGTDTTKWGIRAFDVMGWEFDSCSWQRIPKEHGCYFNSLGSVSWHNCLFGGPTNAEEITGQAIQVVYAVPGTVRGHETGLIDSRMWYRMLNATVSNQWHSVTNCAIVNVGKPQRSERASFALSFFDAAGPDGVLGHPVQVSGCYIQTSDEWTDPNGQVRDCTGAFMAHRRKRVVFTYNKVEYLKGDRDVLQIWGCGTGAPQDAPAVVIEGNQIDASQPVDIRTSSPHDKVLLRRNRGSAQVVISTNPWYVWGNNGWDEGKVVYRGPITENYSTP